MKISVVQRSHQIQHFLELPRIVYKHNPFWIDGPEDHIRSFLEHTSPYSSHCKTRGFLAWDGERPVARVMAQSDEVLNKLCNKKVGHLFFFEALEDAGSEAVSLLETAIDWLGEQGCVDIRMSYLHARQLPLTIDAYDVLPTVFHTYNPPYYHRLIKAAGLKTGKGFTECRIDFTPDLLDRYKKALARIEKEGFILRTFDMKRCESDTEIFRVLHNDTFSHHWGATHMVSLKEALELTAGMQGLMDPEMVVFAEWKGDAIGYIYGFPDLNQASDAVRKSKGTLDLFQAMSHIDTGLLLSGGVKQAFRDSGVARAIGAKILLAMAEKGYSGAAPTLIMDENRASLAFSTWLGAKPWRNFICYEGALK